MLARAERRARRLGRVVQLRETDVCRTDFPADSFDGIVSSFLFCVLGPDQQLPALRELARICKPSGTLRILEYSLSNDPLRRFVMKLWAPWVRWAYGAAFDRNTENYVSQAGLEVVETTFLYHDIIKLIVARPLERQGE
jgi:ubiquinone/menaquinone biosynthesis C-methylase UbiE